MGTKQPVCDIGYNIKKVIAYDDFKDLLTITSEQVHNIIHVHGNHDNDW